MYACQACPACQANMESKINVEANCNCTPSWIGSFGDRGASLIQSPMWPPAMILGKKDRQPASLPGALDDE